MPVNIACKFRHGFIPAPPVIPAWPLRKIKNQTNIQNQRSFMNCFNQHHTDDFSLFNGDCCEVIKGLPDNSVHFQIFSPPFSSLYIYSDSIRDMGNCANDDEFFEQFDFLIPELYRTLLPGRLCAVHCKNLVNYQGRDGKAGLRDFRGEIIRHFIAHDFAYASEVVIWKDPVIEMQRTKANGLLYKTLRKDATFSRQGMPEYLLLFRKWADDETQNIVEPVTNTHESFPLPQWQQWASPVWMDIKQTNVLNVQMARTDADEKHICPLQLDVIERAVKLWTNPGDVVLSPFAGIGSEIFGALKAGRRGLGIELKTSYYEQAIEFCESVIAARSQGNLLDFIEEIELSEPKTKELENALN
jgi:DNA modification methylase